MRIALVHFARLGSERVPNKPLRKVGGERLLDIALRKRAGNDTYVIHPVKDPITFPHNLGNYLLSNGKGRIWPELIQPFIEYFRDYDWIVDCNFICHPFLSESTIDHIFYLCSKLTFPFTLVKEERNTVWNFERELILGKGQLADTKNNPVYFIPAHIAYCYRFKDLSLNEKQLSERVVPIPIQLTKLEQIDIDTEDDLVLANLIAESLNRGSSVNV